MKTFRVQVVGACVFCVLSVLTLWACNDGDGQLPHDDPGRANPEGAGLANPADTKCIEQGYRVEYLWRDGVPVRSLCVNDRTGSNCEAWAWFREECSLDPS